MNKKEHVCCFFGHREIELNDKLISKLKDVVEYLIENKGIDTFLFGSKSQFDELCLSVVSELKKKHSHITRIYVRAEFPYVDDEYVTYLLTKYDHTYYPQKIINSGKSAYIERNYEMIDKSSFCVVYYDKNYIPTKRKNRKREFGNYQPNSGTKRAYAYAQKQSLNVINVFNEIYLTDF